VRILYLHQYFAVPKLGGGIRSFEFARRFARNGHSVDLITAYSRVYDYFKKKTLKIDGFNVHFVSGRYSSKMSFKVRKIAFLKFALASTIKGWKIGKPDIIYATSTPLTVSIPAIILSKLFKVPYVFEVRDLWPEAPIQMGVIKSKYLIKFLKWIERKSYDYAEHIIALSPGIVEGIINCGIEKEKITMVPNSSDIEYFGMVQEKKEKIKEKFNLKAPKIFLYVGAFNMANGVDIILEAAVKLEKIGYKDIHFVLAGDGVKLKELKGYAQENALKNVTFIGRINKEDAAKLYFISCGSFVIFDDVPILKTNSPNKFFDSLAAGKPVITNMDGWIRSLVEENQAGYFFPKRDTNALLDRIISLCELEKSKEMGQNAFNLAKEQFDRDKAANKIENILSTLLDKRIGS